MSVIADAKAEELRAMLEAVRGFEFWNPVMYEDCLKDEYGLSYIGEFAGYNWLVSVSNDGKCLLTIYGRNSRWNSPEDCNTFLIAHFTDILNHKLEEA